MVEVNAKPGAVLPVAENADLLPLVAGDDVPAAYPVWPCCDFYAGKDGLRDRSGGYPWHAAAQGMEGRNAGPHWHQWRHGTELMARSMVRSGAPKSEVDRLMLAMWKLELSTDCDNSAPKEVMQKWSWTGGYP